MFNYKEIREILPQSYPFIMIEKAIFHGNDRLLKGFHYITESDLNHQNKDNTIYPFSFIIEGSAQSCILLYKAMFPNAPKNQFLLTGINNSMINGPCFIGNTLMYVCSFTRIFEKGAFANVLVYVEEEVIGEVNLNFYME